MGTATGVSPTWRARYWADRNRELVVRLRWCVGLCMLGVLSVAAGGLLQWPAAMGVRLGFALKFAAVNLAAWEVTRRRAARRHAAVLALGYVLAMIALNASALRHVPKDSVAMAGSSVALVMTTALLLPWGAVPQIISCAAATAAYAWLLGHVPAAVNLAAIGLVVTVVPVSVIGATLLERHRASSFERAWQQRRLLALARDLAVQAEPEDVVARVLEHGLRLVGAHSVTFSARDAERHMYRIEAVRGATDPVGHWIVGLEIPEDFPLIGQIVERDVVALPDEGIESSVRSMLAEHGVRRALYLAMRCGGEVVGILGFARTEDRPFGLRERQLARGLTDQAAVALRTARLVADLRRANQLKSEFVATMSHELRTPLTVILGFEEMARDRSLAVEEREECLGRIATAGRDLLGLIETTLEIGKIDAGRDEVQLETVALQPLWAGLGETCANLPRGREVRLEWSDAVPAVSLTTDPRKLQIIIRNLVGNALKFTERGWVRVEAVRDGDQLVLRVTDTGIGIRPEDHATVFEMFRQADGSASRRYEGTGLGLYIVRRFVQQLGGTVTLESVVGQGSVFTVTLPGKSAAPPVVRAA